MAERVAPPKPAAEGRWTYERYLRETADGEYFAIIEGEKIVSPSPTFFHQRILLRMAKRLDDWLQQSKLGEVAPAPFDVILGDDEVVQPDLIIVLKSHFDRLTAKNVRGAPDLLVEILSPGSIRLDRARKRALYARHGVPEYWIVSPGERTVEILRLQGAQYETANLFEEDDTLESPSLPGFTCAVKDLFAE